MQTVLNSFQRKENAVHVTLNSRITTKTTGVTTVHSLSTLKCLRRRPSELKKKCQGLTKLPIPF